MVLTSGNSIVCNGQILVQIVCKLPSQIEV